MAAEVEVHQPAKEARRAQVGVFQLHACVQNVPLECGHDGSPRRHGQRQATAFLLSKRFQNYFDLANQVIPLLVAVPCMLLFWSSWHLLRSRKMIAKCSREETLAVPEAMTSFDRLFPPAFGMRFWYIMRLDRLSQGHP